MRADPLGEDTIAAIATAEGRSAIAVVRLSGSRAFEVLAGLTRRPPSELPAARRQALLPIYDPDDGSLIDRALVSRFPGPHSYTGENSVEISCHGGLLTVQLVLNAAVAAGARHALAGEFSRRAVLNGRMDVTQAEAVVDLIDASSPAFQRAAVHQLERGLGRRIDDLRTEVLDLEAMVSYGIDFPDEDEPPVPQSTIIERARRVEQSLSLLLATAPEGEMLKEGAVVALAGRPNAGKSSLFNALVGRERAIVTEIPGTTRDAIEADALLEGFPFRLVDTAGLRSTQDQVEAIGIEVATRYLDQADILLFCAEAGRELTESDRTFMELRSESRPTVVVRTKNDIAVESASGEGIPISVRTGEGMERLRTLIVEIAFGTIRDSDGETSIVTNRRHARELRSAREELQAFTEGMETGVPAEYAATHLRAAAIHLEEIIGVITNDDVLGALFSRFCVGK